MEFVYVVRRQDLFARTCVQGFEALGAEPFESAFGRTIAASGFFVERSHAEHDSSLKQIIPYCIIVGGDSRADGGGPSVLLLRRLPKQGERRLHDKLSIGIGGHINPIDTNADSLRNRPATDGGGTESLEPGARAEILYWGARREISEELDVEPGAIDVPVPVGVINDDSSPVGSVHFGVVFAVAAPQNLQIRERDHMAGEWRGWRQLVNDERAGANFETWSAFILKTLPENQLSEAAGERGALRPACA